MPTLTRIKVMLELGIQIDSWADRGENIDMYACTCYRVNTSHPLTPQSHVETRRNLTKISTAKTIGFQKLLPLFKVTYSKCLTMHMHTRTHTRLALSHTHIIAEHVSVRQLPRVVFSRYAYVRTLSISHA